MSWMFRMESMLSQYKTITLKDRQVVDRTAMQQYQVEDLYICIISREFQLSGHRRMLLLTSTRQMQFIRRGH